MLNGALTARAQHRQLQLTEGRHGQGQALDPLPQPYPTRPQQTRHEQQTPQRQTDPTA